MIARKLSLVALLLGCASGPAGTHPGSPQSAEEDLPAYRAAVQSCEASPDGSDCVLGNFAREIGIDPEACPPGAPVDGVDMSTDPPSFPRLSLPECRSRLITVIEDLAEQSKASQQELFTVAQTYYDFNHFDEAIPAFDAVIQYDPTQPVAMQSARFLIDALKIQEDYAAMQSYIRQFKGIPELHQPPLSDILNDLDERLSFKLCEDPRCYLDFAIQMPDSDLAPRALMAASDGFRREGHPELAIESYMQLIKLYADEPDLASDALFNLAATYESIAVYTNAARFYALFAQHNMYGGRARVAALKAATLYRALGQPDKVEETIALLLKISPHDPAIEQLRTPLSAWSPASTTLALPENADKTTWQTLADDPETPREARADAHIALATLYHEDAKTLAEDEARQASSVAVENTRKALAANPDDLRSFALLALIYHSLDSDLGAHCCRHGQQLRSEHPDDVRHADILEAVCGAP